MPYEVVNKQIKKTQEEILAELHHSVEKNNVVGIFLKDTHELVTTAVSLIEKDSFTGTYIINLLDEDLHGYPIAKNRILLTNIERVIHFNISFDDPQYIKIRRKEKLKA